MRIECLTNFKHGRRDYTKDDQITVDDELGAYFCTAGWAKDLDGNVETVVHTPGDVVLAPAGVMHGHGVDAITREED